jgi:hypothetical protein
MIITKLIGGLGNQMFQYAAGRALALKYGQPLYLDIGDFDDYRLHNGFELPHVFDKEFNIASSVQCKKLLGWRAGKRVQSFLRRSQMIGIRSDYLVLEPHFHYWRGFELLQDDSYLDGYWQSEKYFGEYSSVIRSDFTFKQGMSENNLIVSGRIAACNAVSIHIRRGDYVENSVTNLTHGVCSLGYYKKGIEYIADRVESPCFFIFSDDIDWVRNNLNVGFPHQFVHHNKGIDSYNDMRLMSQCQHHIIANSSFSWWGAWLNSNENKIVIRPRNWFTKQNVDTSDITPVEWVTL